MLQATQFVCLLTHIIIMWDDNKVLHLEIISPKSYLSSKLLRQKRSQFPYQDGVSAFMCINLVSRTCLSCPLKRTMARQVLLLTINVWFRYVLVQKGSISLCNF